MTDLSAALAPILSRVRQDVTAARTAAGRVMRTNQPITAERIAQHLNGGPARGVYPIKPGENVCSVAMLDLDSHKGETPWEEMTRVAGMVIDSLSLNGLQAIPWRSSGGKGAHLFLIWEQPQDAWSVRETLRGILSALGYKEGTRGVKEKEIEIFPRQARVEEGRFGNQFWLPLAGASAPLEPLAGLAVMPRSDARLVEWPVSAPVKAIERPVLANRTGLEGEVTPDLEKIRMMLTHIERRVDYDLWIKVGMAVHYESAGSDQGFELWWEWSVQNEVTVEEARYKWESFGNDRDHPVTKGTLMQLAREGGWVEDIAAEFEDLDKADEMAVADPIAVITDPRDHLAIARRILATRYRWGKCETALARIDGDWYEFTGARHEMKSEEAVRGAVRLWLSRAGRKVVVKKKKKDIVEGGSATLDFVEPFRPSLAEITSVVDALKTAAADDHAMTNEGWDRPQDIMVLQDGLFDLATRTLAPHTPKFFSLNVLPYSWAQADRAERPCAWLKFIEDLWPGDIESQHCLQEIMGYLLTSDTSQQKMFLVQGPPRSGKGTIGRVIREMCGPNNCADTTFKQLAGDFGMQSLIGKTVALLSEARQTGGRHVNVQDAVEQLLKTTGEDGALIERKHKTAWEGVLKTRFLMLANQVPALGDDSGAFVSRFITLKIGRSWLGVEDTGLTGRLLAELPGIMRWSLEGLDRLRARGRFHQPSSGESVFEELADANNHVRVFVRERCRLGVGLRVKKEDLYGAYRDWCIADGRHSPSMGSVFGRALMTEYKGVKSGNATVTEGRYPIYYGIGIGVDDDGADDLI